MGQGVIPGLGAKVLQARAQPKEKKIHIVSYITLAWVDIKCILVIWSRVDYVIFIT